MEIIPMNHLQNLANIIANEGNVSLKNQLSAWVTAKAGNSDHVALSSLAGLAHYSSVKEQILEWVSNISNPKPEFIYVPDIPAQMEDEIEYTKGDIQSLKIEEDAIQIETADEVYVRPTSIDGETMGEGNPEPEITSNESEVENKEEIVKPKKTRKKKND